VTLVLVSEREARARRYIRYGGEPVGPKDR
jgi:hypothetical protein